MPNTRLKSSKNPFERRRVSAAVLAAFALVSSWTPAASWAEPEANPKTYEVAEVLSGDTLRLTTGSVVSYASIAAPPLVHQDPKIREYGRQALEFNKKLVEGKRVRIEFGYRIKNDDGVYQGFVFLEDGTFVNLKMIEAGFAKLNILPPNLQYADELRRAARYARHDGEGLWEHENETSRKKIFIADKMTRKFHLEGCPDLEGVSKAHLDRFESSVEAKAAGFSFCKICRNSYSQQTDLF